jgi:iron(III) transport system ATP-binding protein
LLDEPLSNLDAKLRLEMRAEIRRVCKEFNLTTVYVTHDQKEALSISDRMAILENGRILQVGSPREVYCRPTRKTVANFIGETDFIEGRVCGFEREFVFVDTLVGRFEGVLGDPALRPSLDDKVTVSIRPECWKLGPVSGRKNSVAGRIGEAIYLGEVAQYDFVASADGSSLKIYELNPRYLGTAAGLELYPMVEPEDVVVLVQ